MTSRIAALSTLRQPVKRPAAGHPAIVRKFVSAPAAIRGAFTLLVAGLIASAATPADAAEPTAGPASLFAALRQGDARAITRLIRDGVDVNARDSFGNTPLLAAALNSDADAMERLIQAGAQIDATNHAGATALLQAATFEEKARLLVKHGARINARSVIGNSPLILAARKAGNIGTVRFLLDHGADLQATNSFGATPLLAAAASGDIEIVRLLLDRGANVNAQPTMDVGGFIWGGGRTALMWAALNGDEPMLRLLLERGARINAFGVAGSALHQAAWANQPGTARLLLDSGAQVNQRDLIANYTPLHWAASCEHASPDLTQLLLARGADVNAEGGQPVDNFLGSTRTPFSLARLRGDTPILQALLQAGATAERADVAPVSRQTQPTAGASDTDKVPATEPAIRSAIERALGPLGKTAEESVQTFRRHASRQDCLSCHQQQLPLAALGLARTRHLGVDASVLAHQTELARRDLATASVSPADPRITEMAVALEPTFHPEATVFAGYAALGFHFQQLPGDTLTDALVHLLVTMQHADGHWTMNLPRPPIQASPIGATALAVYTLRSYGPPARQREIDGCLARARAWLAGARAESNEERVHQLLGLAWAGGKKSTLHRLAASLTSAQRPDGGWSQLAGLESDAYATGQALYALMESGRAAAKDVTVRRGVEFLLKTQLPDGTWHVRRRAHPFQPPMSSGFPHGADGWISSAASSWAAMALTLTLDASHSPALPSHPNVLIAASSPTFETASPTTATAIDGGKSVDFARDIQPVLERSCASCHSGQRPKGGFSVATRTAFLRGGARGEAAVVPGHADSSPLIHAIRDQIEDLEMPPRARRDRFPALSADEITRLEAWINQGASWPENAAIHAR